MIFDFLDNETCIYSNKKTILIKDGSTAHPPKAGEPLKKPL